jgi:predicted DNA-binding transcriptional regulator AlpA
MVTRLLRYRDLEAAGIVNSWTALRYKIKHNGFPLGRYIGANSRAWTVDEVQQWLDALPTQNPSPRKSGAEAAENARAVRAAKRIASRDHEAA